MVKAPRRRRWVTLSLCAAVVALTLVYLLVGDSTIWGEWISVAPSVVWAVLLLPSVVRLRSWALFGFLMGFLLLTTEWPRWHSTTSATAGPTMRVVSWNIGAGNVHWAEAVKELKPDIVLVQENMSPLEVWEGFRWYSTPDPGVLLRYPADVLPTEKVGPWTEPQLLLANVEGRKVLIANVRLMLPSSVIQIVDPLHENPIENYRARVGQYEKLAHLLKAAADKSGARAILLAGDFNIPARMQSLDPLRGFLKDVWLAAGSGWGPTVPEFLPLTRIDQMWVSAGLEAVSVKVVRIAGSDHRGIVAELAFREER